jgi:glycosyltransferase involved in cell wall biosynthesis
LSALADEHRLDERTEYMPDMTMPHDRGVISDDFDGISGATLFRTPAAFPRQADRADVDFTIFIACYNEEENIIASLDVVVAALKELARPWEVIVVDDASDDTSVSLVTQYMGDHPDYPLILLVRGENRGLAQNFIDAAFLGRGRYYKLVCGDNVENSRDIVAVLGRAGEADMVLPYHRNVIANRTPFRRFVSWLFPRLINRLTGYDLRYYNGCGVNLRHNVLRWHSNCLGFDFQADLVVRMLDQGKTYIEVPIEGRERQFGASKAVTYASVVSTFRFIANLLFLRLGKSFGKRKRLRG